jgi:ABC-type transport system involved in multi-copper enzyme maturation permease subunit
MNLKQEHQKIAVYLNTSRVFALAELKRNLLVFLLPTPFFIGLKIYQSCNGTHSLGLYGTWTMLIMAAIFAMTYGLQCFSNETDKRTLDFILTRPLSPYLIISVKYGLSLLFLLGWFTIFTGAAPLSLNLLPLVEGMGLTWILLILLMIHSISFFSGLLARGLERLFVITVLTGLLAGICYYFWSSCFSLIKANVYWFDILPVQLYFIKVVIPTYLALLCLATPFTGTVWYLRSRIPIWHFNPAKWLFGFWLASYGVVLVCLWLLAPPVWPDETTFYGDWHDRGGIVLSGPLKIVGEDSIHKIDNNQVTTCDISLSQLGRKSHRIYMGQNIIKPHFSPDGAKLVFTEQRQLKILDLKTRRRTLIGPGDIAAWSADSRKLICARHIGKEDLSKLFIYDLDTKTVHPIGHNLPVSAFAWDSARDTIYYLGYKTEVSSFNLITKQIKSFTTKFDREKPLNYYGIIIPNMLFVPETGNIVWGHVCEDELRIYELDPQSGGITLAENLVSPRMKNAAPVLINPNYQAFIWQRQDGSFVYQATRYAGREDAEHHHNAHEHEYNHERSH